MRGNWSSVEGRQVRSWLLVSFFGERGGRAFFLATNVSGGDERLLEIVEADSREALDLEASWKRAQEIAEPHLLSVYAIDRGEIDYQALLFAVLDLPEDDLGEMIGRRAFEPAEARAAFSDVARGLDALHKRGLQHGRVTPSNVFLVKGAYRLSVDSIAPAGNGGIEEDLRELGATLVQAMTGITVADVADAPAVLSAAEKLRPPFYDIVMGCLNRAPERKWTAERVLEALSRGAGTERTAGAVPQGSKGSQRSRWTVAALLAVVLLAAFHFLAGRDSSSHVRDHDQPLSAVARGSTPQQRLSEEHVPEPARPEPAERGTSSKDARPVFAAKRGSWGVIAATYTSFRAAQRRAEAIEKRAPQLHPSVFPHDAEAKYFYVVLGSGLTEDAAARLRKHAIARGAPGDTYVTKLDDK